MTASPRNWFNDFVQLLTRSSLVRIGQQMFVAEGIRAFFMLAGSIVTVRYLGGELYGAYQFFFACVAVLMILVQFWDSGITRFLPTASFDGQVDIIFGVLCCKVISFVAVSIVAVFVYFLFLADSALVLDRLIDPAIVTAVVILLLELPASLVLNTLTGAVLALQHFRRMLIFNLTRSFLVLVWTVFVALIWAPPVAEGLVWILAGRATIIAACTLWLGWGLGRITPGFYAGLVRRFAQPSAAFLPVRDIDFRRYTIPFIVTTFTGYVRDQLPIIALGAFASLNDVAIYRIVATVFQFLFTFFVNAGRFLLPGLVKARDHDAEHFDYRFAVISAFYLCNMALLAFVLLIANTELLAIWDLRPTAYVEILFVFAGLNLIIDAAAGIEIIGFTLGKDMRRMVPASIGRAAIQGLALFLLTPVYGLVGPAVALLSGTVWLYLFVAWSSVRTGARASKFVRAVLLQTLVLAIAYAICAYIVVSTAAG